MKALIGNKVTEKDVREWLTTRGYKGSSAQFDALELYAIQRPGWLQVFRFEANVRRVSDNRWVRLYGAVRDDERFLHTDIEVFDKLTQRDQQLNDWSKGLVTAQSEFRTSSLEKSVQLSTLQLLIFSVCFVVSMMGLAVLISVLFGS